MPNVRAWLAATGLDLEVITAAVLCHHLKASYKEWGRPRTQVKQVELYLDHPEVINILQRIAQIAGVDGLPELPGKWIAGDCFWEQVYENAKHIGSQFSRKVKRERKVSPFC